MFRPFRSRSHSRETTSKILSRTLPHWALLIVVSLACTWVLHAIRLPASLMLGPMLAALLLAVRGLQIKIPAVPFLIAQGILGVMIADNLPTDLMGEIKTNWWVFLAGTLSTIVMSSFLGWLLSRSKLLPGTTAIWGSSPGGATVMVLMSESYGADMRLVAFMQYLRMLCCATAAALVAHFAGSSNPMALPTQTVMASTDHMAAVITLAFTLASIGVGVATRIPGAPLLLPMAVGMIVKSYGLTPIVLPSWALVISYALLGWGIGSRFDRQVIIASSKVFGRVLASILILIVANGLFSLLLVRLAGIDPLTAFLATNPGGADSVAVIATSVNVDMPFVMSMQVARFLVVLVTGPAIAKWVSARSRC